MKLNQKNNKKILVALNELLSSAYEIADKKLINKFSKNFLVSEEASKIVLRRTTVPLIFYFFQNLVFLSEQKYKLKKKLKLIEFKHSFLSIENFDSATTNKNFNIKFVNYLSTNLFLKKIINHKTENTKLNNYYKNNLFVIEKLFLIKIFEKIETFFFRYIPFFNRIPVSHISQLQSSFYGKGWYLYFLKNLDYDFKINNVNINLIKRKTFFSSVLPVSFFNKFFIKFNLKGLSPDFVHKVFHDFFISSFPISFFENFQDNFNEASLKLRYTKKKIILCSGDYSTRSIFLNCAAKNKKFKIIKIQHGGYEGYSNYLPRYNEIEYATADYFLSWGWKEIVGNKKNQKIKVIPMPSPWLSDRKLYFAKTNQNLNSKKYDILFMPSKIVDFPTSPFDINNINFLNKKKNIINFEKILLFSKKNQFKFCCKFYDQFSFEYYKQNIKYKLSDFPNINFLKTFDKGLDKDLLSSSKLVLWDVPGTGFLECLACRIPTVCFCDSDIFIPTKKSLYFFNKLKNEGIVNYNYNTLYKSLADHINSNLLIQNTKEYKNSINLFLKKFAKTDDNWDIIWKNKLKHLSRLTKK